MPVDAFDIIIKRLDRIDTTLDGIQRDVRAFDPARCDRHEKYITRNAQSIAESQAIRAESRRMVAAGWARLSVLVTIAGAAGGVVVALLGG